MLLRLYHWLTRLLGGLIVQRLGNNPKFEGTMDERTGKDLPEWNGDSFTVWLHGVSVGEVKALAPLAEEWRERYPKHSILVTTTTKTGRKQAEDLLAETADAICYFPFDLPRVLTRFLVHFQPDLYVAMEAEAWPNLLGRLNRREVPAVQANGKISLHNKELGIVRAFFQGLYDRFDLILAQSELMARRYRDLLGDSAPVGTTGNTKYSDYPQAVDEDFLDGVRTALGWEEGPPPLIVASTHPLDNGEVDTEEELIMRALAGVDDSVLPERMIVAPRHPERSATVREVLESGPLPRKNIASMQALEEGGEFPGADTLLVDTIGHLGKLYPLCELAVIGGTFNDSVGGHNVYEAVQHGVVTLIGPHDFTIEPEVEALSESGALLQVEDGEGLEERFTDLLNATGEIERRGAAGVEVVQQSSGSAGRTVEALEELLAGVYEERFTARSRSASAPAG